jgi:hypothetical protein
MIDQHRNVREQARNVCGVSAPIQHSRQQVQPFSRLQSAWINSMTVVTTAQKWMATGSVVVALASVVVGATAAYAQSAADTGASTGASTGATRPIKAVVELFTSQGCSSCPKADALMEKTYSRRSDVLALSFAVDYWDYIGWKDTNASPRNSARQRDYAKTRGDGAVYTPQMVVNGRAHSVGSQGGEIDQALVRTAAATQVSWVPLTVSSGTSGITVAASAASKGEAVSAQLLLVGIKRRQEVGIDRGENAGRSITYVNIVRELKPIGTWTGVATSFAIPPDQIASTACDAYAVILQRGQGGPVIGAATIGAW